MSRLLSGTSRKNPGVLLGVNQHSDAFYKAIETRQSERRKAIEEGVKRLQDAGKTNSIIVHRYGLFKAGKLMPTEAETLRKTVESLLAAHGLTGESEPICKAALSDAPTAPAPASEQPLQKASASFTDAVDIARRAERMKAAGFPIPAFRTEVLPVENDYLSDGIFVVAGLAKGTKESDKENLCKSILDAEQRQAAGLPPEFPITSKEELARRAYALKAQGVDVEQLGFSDDFNFRLNSLNNPTSPADFQRVCKAVITVESAQRAKASGLPLPSLDSIEPSIAEPNTPAEAQRRGLNLLKKGVTLPGFNEFQSALVDGKMTQGLFSNICEQITQAERTESVNLLRKAVGVPLSATHSAGTAQDVPVNALPRSWRELWTRSEELLRKGVSVPGLWEAGDKFNSGTLTGNELRQVAENIARLEAEHGIFINPTSPTSAGGVDALVKALAGEPMHPVQPTRPTQPKQPQAAQQPKQPIAPKEQKQTKQPKPTEGAGGAQDGTSETDKTFNPQPKGQANVQMFHAAPDGSEPGDQQHENCRCVVIPASTTCAALMLTDPGACPNCIRGAAEFNAQASAQWHEQNGLTAPSEGMEPMPTEE